MEAIMRKVVVVAAFMLLALPDLHRMGVQGFCPHHCDCDDTSMRVECFPEAKLDVIPITLNPSIKQIHLRGNKIRTVDASFQFYGQLEFVDFSENHMVELPENCFGKQQKLRELHMDTNEIETVSNKTFKGLKSLAVLSMRGNLLTALPDTLFVFLPELQVLDLGRNEIEKIGVDTFSGLVHLHTLRLDGNKLASTLSASILRPIAGNLASLDMGKNPIVSLGNDAFLSLSVLRSLNLSGASITNVSYTAFRGLGGLYSSKRDTGLKSLSLAFNALDRFPSASLSRLNNLEHLHIGGNFIERLETSDLSGLSNILQEVDLAGSQNLVKIGAFLFANQPNLTKFTVSESKQLTIEPDAFTLHSQGGRQLNLKLLDLGWIDVPAKIVDWSQVASIDLEGNPIDCSCQTLWLKDVLHAINDTDTTSSEQDDNSVICQTPTQFKGQRLLEDVPRSELDCSAGGLVTDTTNFVLTTFSGRSRGDQFIMVSVCVSAALTLGLVILVGVHGGRQLKRCRNSFPECVSQPLRACSECLCCSRRSSYGFFCKCCDKNDAIADISPPSELVSSPDQACCSCVVVQQGGPSRGQPKRCNIQHLDYNYMTQHSAYSSQHSGLAYNDFEFLHADFNNTVNTKSSYMGGTDEETDYFLSLSKDRKYLKPIPVSEL